MGPNLDTEQLKIGSSVHLQKPKFIHRLKNRLSLRLHMTLIFLATGLSGLLTARCLLAAGVENIVIRYPLAVLFSYLMFFCLIKLWLKYLAVAPAQQLREKKSSFGDTLSNFADIPSGSGSGGSFSGAGGHFAGAGGQFSGGGASGGFENMGTVITEGSGKAFAESAGNVMSEHGGSAIGDAVGGVADGALSGLGDEGGLVGIVVLAVIGAVIAVVLGAGIYMIYDAPFILSEAAFEVVLAASLVRSSRTMAEPDWIGSVFRTTWKPFGISLLVAGIGAVVIHANYPHVTRISELMRQALR
jgi:hypothetical protein